MIASWLLLRHFVCHEAQLRIRLLPEVVALDLWCLVDGVRFGAASDDTLEPAIRSRLVVRCVDCMGMRI